MTFWQAYARFWTQAFNLKDRARRLEYWAPNLVHFGIIAIGAIILLFMLFSTISQMGGFGPGLNDTGTQDTNESIWGPIISTIIVLIFTIPNFSLLFRRFQDLNISGWWALVPEVLYSISEIISISMKDTMTANIITGISLFIQLVIFIMMFFRGTKGSNKYGPDPYTGVYSDRTY